MNTRPFDMRRLPSELQQMVLCCIHTVCTQEMGNEELCTLRLVDTRMAKGFYKRCIMLTMFKRYSPFLFPVFREPTNYDLVRPYDLDLYFDAPCKLPKCHINLWEYKIGFDTWRTGTDFQYLCIKAACDRRMWIKRYGCVTRAPIGQDIEENKKNIKNGLCAEEIQAIQAVF